MSGLRFFSSERDGLRRLFDLRPRANSLRPVAAVFLPVADAIFLACGAALRLTQASSAEVPRTAFLRACCRPSTSFCLRLGAGGGSLGMEFSTERSSGDHFDFFPLSDATSFLAAAAASSSPKRERTSSKRALACSGFFCPRRMRPIWRTASACQ